ALRGQPADAGGRLHFGNGVAGRVRRGGPLLAGGDVQPLRAGDSRSGGAAGPLSQADVSPQQADPDGGGDVLWPNHAVVVAVFVQRGRRTRLAPAARVLGDRGGRRDHDVVGAGGAGGGRAHPGRGASLVAARTRPALVERSVAGGVARLSPSAGAVRARLATSAAAALAGASRAVARPASPGAGRGA